MTKTKQESYSHHLIHHENCRNTFHDIAERCDKTGAAEAAAAARQFERDHGKLVDLYLEKIRKGRGQSE